MLPAPGGENSGYPGETGVVWAEIGTVFKIARNGRGTETENGGADAGEGAGTLSAIVRHCMRLLQIIYHHYLLS